MLTIEGCRRLLGPTSASGIGSPAERIRESILVTMTGSVAKKLEKP